jgi:tripartite-type tricarboxylate transporter receptor subunit TctC
VERKEVDGQANFYSSLKPYISRGVIRPLIRSGRTSAPGIENLPIDEDLATDKRGKTLLALRSAADVIARPYVAPPKTSPEIMKMLRVAFAQVEKDPAFLADAEKNLQATDYVPADEIMKVLDFIMDQPEDIVREFGRYVKF